MPLPTSKIDHLGIAVTSIADARAFYQSLGLIVVAEETVESEGVKTAMLPVGESRIELLEALSPDTPVGRFIAKRGPGLHHIALHVNDISAAFESMKASGARLLSDDIQIGAGGHFYFFIHPASAGGVLTEICQDGISDV
jgi:methylmalonyl-CoA/ethylmalonyl-CoA epimerase